MGDKTTIEWTDATWNPVRGCSIVSKGCTNCYAMRQAHRSSGAGGAYEGLTKITKGGPVWTGDVRLMPELLEQPRHWRRPRRIFVNSMSDLFHEDVPDWFIANVFFVMAYTQRHVFQILTKRPRRMLEWVTKHGLDAVRYGERLEHEAQMRAAPWPLPNVWLGVSVEDQERADERIPLLLRTPAAVRWISAEPLLGPVDLALWIKRPDINYWHGVPKEALDWKPYLHWVVGGGESGPGARPMHPDWARSLRDQCAAAGVPFFFKQWGAWGPACDYYDDDDHRDASLDLPHELLTRTGGIWKVGTPGTNERHDGQPPAGTWVMHPVGKKLAGRNLDGRTHNEYPA